MTTAASGAGSDGRRVDRAALARPWALAWANVALHDMGLALAGLGMRPGSLLAPRPSRLAYLAARAADFAAFLSHVGSSAGQPAPAAAPPAGFEPPSFGCGLSCIQQCQFLGCQPTCVNNLNCFCHCGP